MKVLVLGGGVIGVTTAYYLARAGHEVELVDRQAGRAGHGSAQVGDRRLSARPARGRRIADGAAARRWACGRGGLAPSLRRGAGPSARVAACPKRLRPLSPRCR